MVSGVDIVGYRIIALRKYIFVVGQVLDIKEKRLRQFAFRTVNGYTNFKIHSKKIRIAP